MKTIESIESNIPSKVESQEYVENLTSPKSLEELRQQVGIEKVEKVENLQKENEHFVDVDHYIDELGQVKRKEVKKRKFDILEMRMDKFADKNDENRDYFNVLAKKLSIEERKDVARLTGEMTQGLKNDMKERSLKNSFQKRNMTVGVAGYLNKSNSKIVKLAGGIIGGMSTKITQLSFNVGNFFGLDKSLYLTKEEAKIDTDIQRKIFDEKEVKSIRAEAMKTVADRSSNLTKHQKQELNKTYQDLRLETEGQKEQVKTINENKSIVDKIKSPIEDLISSASLKKLARGAKKVGKYALVTATALSTKLALNTVVPFVGWVAGGAVGGSMREIINRSSYNFDSWKQEIDILEKNGEIAKAKALARSVMNKKWIVGERVDYQKWSNIVRQYDDKNVESKNFEKEIKNIKDARDVEHNRKIGKSAVVGAMAGGVVGFFHTLGGILFHTPAYGHEEVTNTSNHTDVVDTKDITNLDHIYNSKGQINLTELKEYCDHKGILYDENVKEVVKENTGYFADKDHLYEFLNKTGEGHVGYSKEVLADSLADGENGLPDYSEHVSFDNGVKHVEYDYSNTFGEHDVAKSEVNAWVKEIPGDKGYAIVVDKNGVEHMVTVDDNLGQIVDNHGDVLSQYPGEPADLYINGNSCDNLYTAIQYHDVDGVNHFLHNLGDNPDMIVRGTDGQTLSQWILENGSRFNETNYDLLKWIAYRDPAGAKEVMNVICDDKANYALKKELYEYYLNIPTDSPRWEEGVDVLNIPSDITLPEAKIELPVEEIKVNDVPVDTTSVHDEVAQEVAKTRPSYMNDNLEKYLGENKVTVVDNHVDIHDHNSISFDESIDKDPAGLVEEPVKVEPQVISISSEKINPSNDPIFDNYADMDVSDKHDMIFDDYSDIQQHGNNGHPEFMDYSDIHEAKPEVSFDDYSDIHDANNQVSFDDYSDMDNNQPEGMQFDDYSKIESDVSNTGFDDYSNIENVK